MISYFQRPLLACLLVCATARPAVADNAASLPSSGPGLTSTTPVPKTGAEEQESVERQQARARFEAGMKLYEEGDYPLALLEFERTYTLIPEYRVLYNIAQVNIQLGRFAAAMRRLQQYLAEGGPEIPAERKASVLKDLDMLATRTATILVRVNVPAQILLDDDVIATASIDTPLLINAGEHRLTVRKDGYVTETRRIALAGHDQLELQIHLTEESRRPVVEKTLIIERQTATDPTVERRQLLLTAGWVGTGLLATAWATSGYMGYTTAHSREAKLTEATSADELSSLKSKTKHWYVAADVFGGLTLGAAATLTYLTFFASGSTQRARAHTAPKRNHFALDCTTDRILVSGTF